MTSKDAFTEDAWVRPASGSHGGRHGDLDRRPGRPIELTKETMASLKSASSPPSSEELLTAVSQDIMCHGPAETERDGRPQDRRLAAASQVLTSCAACTNRRGEGHAEEPRLRSVGRVSQARSRRKGSRHGLHQRPPGGSTHPARLRRHVRAPYGSAPYGGAHVRSPLDAAIKAVPGWEGRHIGDHADRHRHHEPQLPDRGGRRGLRPAIWPAATPSCSGSTARRSTRRDEPRPRPASVRRSTHGSRRSDVW